MNRFNRPSLTKPLALGAMVVGIAFGSYGIAAAASDNSSNSTAGSAAASTQPAQPARPGPPPGANPQNPWGGQRSDETVLTGNALEKVKEAALAKLGQGATVVRIETDADGHAAYEAHMLKADGTPATVYVDKSFDVVGVESR
jgi:uncharacterized membrane protein YkoI